MMFVQIPSPMQRPAFARPAAQRGPWPLQQGQPLREAKYSQQQCKCNHRQLGAEPSMPSGVQMH